MTSESRLRRTLRGNQQVNGWATICRCLLPQRLYPLCDNSRFAGGSIFLFNRKAVRFFRKDGHNWRKKADGKTVRETHEKLKAGFLPGYCELGLGSYSRSILENLILLQVGNMDILNCYYAHADQEHGQQVLSTSFRCHLKLASCI